MIAGLMLLFAVVAVVCVVAGEIAELPLRRRILGAGRSRIEASAQRPRLRLGS